VDRRAPIVRRAALLLAGALAAGCAHGSRGPFGDWHAVRGEHFILYTDSSSDSYNAAVHDLEAMHAALNQLFFPNTQLNDVEVLLFDTPDAQRRARSTAHDNPPAVRPAIKDRPMVLDARTEHWNSPVNYVGRHVTGYESQAAIEMARRFLKANMPKAPAWFRIGIEKYVQTVQIHGGEARFGHRLVPETAELKDGKAIPLSQLIAANAREFNSGDWRRSYQASAWAFIHWLMGGERGAVRPKFDLIARGLIEADDGSPETSRRVIEKAFEGTPFAQIEARARDYSVEELGRKPYVDSLTLTIQNPPPTEYASLRADGTRVAALIMR
jgi:hypothetical protein